MISISLWPTFSSSQASVTAVGRPAATSRAKVGPDRTAMGWFSVVSVRTSVIKEQVPCSTPFEQMTRGVPGCRPVRRLSTTHRKNWDGTTNKMAAECADAAARSLVATMSDSRSTSGRNIGFPRPALMDSTTSGSRTHITASCPFRRTTQARAVPQAPPPMIVILDIPLALACGFQFVKRPAWPWRKLE